MNRTSTADEPLALDERWAAIALTLLAVALAAFMGTSLTQSLLDAEAPGSVALGLASLFAASLWAVAITVSGLVTDYRAFTSTSKGTPA